jgi:hypothetical protein
MVPKPTTVSPKPVVALNFAMGSAAPDLPKVGVGSWTV